ncbi:unnamed protein product [Chironomus riparius]|uniref:Exuperantia SAM-like domain-containing protein n=1 Tax=Chironomus riparius TaxID=315576 RepID=A0A9N9RLQ9_9DIPT|nr:unnamed protein product [Chironomus riparius]
MVAEIEYANLEGRYKYVGFDVDTTGRRLIDEILQIAAYTPDEQFSQHIMPLMNLNPGARQRHQVRVINVGNFRMLKCMKSYKVIKTKTEIATLMDLLCWLEKINDEKDGIILLYHEQSKLAPYMLIESMKRFNLFDRFNKIVKGFVNGYELCGDDQKGKGLKYLTLAQNYKVHADCLKMDVKESEEFEGNATVRAKLSFEICKLMSYEGEIKEQDEKEIYDAMNKFVSNKARPIDRELDELVEMEESITRQTDMRDIFLTYFSTSRFHRRRALDFRRALADQKHDSKTLQAIWDSEKREGIEKLVKGLESIKEEDHEELINILEHHYDPEQKPFKPVVRRENNGSGRGGQNIRRRGSQRMNNKENRGSRPNSGRRRSRTNSRRRMSGGSNMNPKTGNVQKDQEMINDCGDFLHSD